ncbi:uncharacterized protein FA14DRAFT_120326 [Meira miltonrushii]|uniref:protein-histidine N-methyltransferase n=1 Tax=Meira miltonrushii TaxID=1280837 RepID=A0A316VD59_9BASI|nr:uncharacterized protein FA14DRAFT_120326 [Meira miltonrushii]PWN35254.1 hypothetical protein FA14DRAFT_120326 [Meira miltonrushii]
MLDTLITSLPSKLSYTRIEVPVPQSDETFYVYRRDLFDARFQMLHEDEEGSEEEQKKSEEWKSVMAGAATDLVPGVYEGGLKTWECSLDLAGVLAQKLEQSPDFLQNKKVIELGCGTAVPSLYLLSKVLKRGDEKPANLTLQLCDFNEQVLQMVTLPNLLLTWYFHSNEEKEDQGQQGDVELSDEIIDGFLDDLRKYQIDIQFYSGHWEGLTAINAINIDSLPNIILTSETIYSTDTMPILIDTLEEAYKGSLEGETKSDVKSMDRLCLVAAKVVYFGVGGGVYAFEQELKRRQASTKTVWKSEKGVSRVVLQVDW